MIPTTLKTSKQFVNDEYVTQGMVTQEMRQASRKYGIPIVTITQNNRAAENYMVEMSNSLMGDSIKKIRYSDSIIMIRQRSDIDVFDSQVSTDVNIGDSYDIGNVSDYLQYIIPFEAKITKAKDGDKGGNKFHIFNKRNLRIYDDFNEAISDLKKCDMKSNELLSKLSIIGLTGVDMKRDIEIDDNDPFDNLLIN